MRLWLMLWLAASLAGCASNTASPQAHDFSGATIGVSGGVIPP
jgi:uncharacterized lipoprotein YmbA